MNIAFILPSLANKGPVILAVDLIKFLISQGHHCDVYYFDDIKELDIPCHAERISFFKRIDFDSYQIIHSHMFRPDVYCAIYKSSIKKSTKVISTIHIAVHEDLKYTHGIIKSFLTIPFWIASWKIMDHIVVLTNTAKEYYSHTKFRAVSVINNGRDIPETFDAIPAEDLQVIETMKQNHTLLGSVCVLDKRKGLEQVLKLLAVHSQYAFIIIGDGKERADLQNLALKHGLAERFHIMGSRKDGYRYLPHFDLFVIPSRSEGMPLALLEAMAFSIPIVGSEIKSFRDEYGEDVMNFFDLDNLVQLHEACQNALIEKRSTVNKAYTNYANRYTVSFMAKKYISLYQSIINNS
jgi:glycosyltransferase involved in cell wall biosynthesis